MTISTDPGEATQVYGESAGTADGATHNPVLRALPLRCKLCGAAHPPAAYAVCGDCLGPLEPAYPASRALPGRATIARRPRSLWRYREWLPFAGAPRHSLDTGWTPLLDAPRLARALGVGRVWIKNDAASHPTHSFKDRVVALAINAASALDIPVIGCASTGNLAHAVAAHAAQAGLRAWVFVPEDLESAKLVATAVFGARLVRVRGHYDDVNRLCTQLADRFGWGIVNVNLRAYYADGSKTVAFEIAEQLGWRFPTAVVAPMAGGSLASKLHSGFAEFAAAGVVHGTPPRLYGAQAEGCAPIVRLFERGGDRVIPEVPRTIVRSLAIGTPADARFAVHALRSSGGGARAVDDAAVVRGIRLLAETTGVFTETAGGVTVAAAAALARDGVLAPDDEVVLCITGNGLKTPDVVADTVADAPVVNARVAEVSALVSRVG